MESVLDPLSSSSSKPEASLKKVRFSILTPPSPVAAGSHAPLSEAAVQPHSPKSIQSPCGGEKPRHLLQQHASFQTFGIFSSLKRNPTAIPKSGRKGSTSLVGPDAPANQHPEHPTLLKRSLSTPSTCGGTPSSPGQHQDPNVTHLSLTTQGSGVMQHNFREDRKALQQMSLEQRRPRRPHATLDNNDGPSRPHNMLDNKDRPSRPHSMLENKDRPSRPHSMLDNKDRPSRPHAMLDNKDRPRRPHAMLDNNDGPSRPHDMLDNKDRPSRPHSMLENKDRPSRPHSMLDNKDRPSRPHSMLDNKDRPSRPHAMLDNKDRPSRPHAMLDNKDRPRRPHATLDNNDRPSRPHSMLDNKDRPSRPHSMLDNKDRPSRSHSMLDRKDGPCQTTQVLVFKNATHSRLSANRGSAKSGGRRNLVPHA
uniref:Uncharacterized protein n=1 Tax=Eptatretus burgeri TaxID=7764 RepID=A0A8C4Q7P7_EPTBU